MKLVLVYVSTIFSSACTIDSAFVDAGGIEVTYTARADGTDGTALEATLFAGDRTVVLTGGDRLVASFGEEAEPMFHHDEGLENHYSSFFRSDLAGDEFKIVLERDGRREASAVVTLPVPFAIAPLATTASRARPLSVTWTSTGTAEPDDEMSWTVESACLAPASGTLPASALELDLPAGKLVKRDGAETPDTCSARLVLVRARDGQVNAGFAGGSAFAVQIREVEFTTTP